MPGLYVCVFPLSDGAGERDSLLAFLFGPHVTPSGCLPERVYGLPVHAQARALHTATATLSELTGGTVALLAAFCARSHAHPLMHAACKSFLDAAVPYLRPRKRAAVVGVRAAPPVADDDVAVALEAPAADGPAPDSPQASRYREACAQACREALGGPGAADAWAWGRDWEGSAPPLSLSAALCAIITSAAREDAAEAALVECCEGWDAAAAPDTLVRDVFLALADAGFTRSSYETVIAHTVLPMVQQLDRNPSRCLLTLVAFLSEKCPLACANALIAPLLSYAPAHPFASAQAQVVQAFLKGEVGEEVRLHIVRRLVAQGVYAGGPLAPAGPATCWVDASFPLLQSLLLHRQPLELGDEDARALFVSLVSVATQAPSSIKCLTFLLAVLPRYKDHPAFAAHQGPLLAPLLSSTHYLAKSIVSKLS